MKSGLAPAHRHFRWGRRTAVVAATALATASTVWVTTSADGAPKRVTLEAEVVRQTDTGFALEWTEFAPEAARALYAPRMDATTADIVPFQARARRAGS